MVNAGQFKPAQVRGLMLFLGCGEGRLGTTSPGSTGGFGLPGSAPPGLVVPAPGSGLALGESFHVKMGFGAGILFGKTEGKQSGV